MSLHQRTEPVFAGSARVGSRTSIGVKPKSSILPTREEIKEALPGLLVVVLPIALISEFLWWLELSHRTTFFVDIFIAAVLALIVANLWEIPDQYKAGPAFAQKWFLRLGIIIYGLKFNYSYLAKTGWQNLLLVMAAVVLAISASMIIGKLLGLDPKTSALIGNGTAICGITALMATSPSIRAREENTAIAIGTVLLWGTLGLFIYPIIATVFGIPPDVFGAWTGATIHDLPQIIATATQGGGKEALEAALFVKMIRIAFIIVVVLGMNIYFYVRERRKEQDGGMVASAIKSLPGFVIIFFLVVLINTLIKIPASISGPLATWPTSVFPTTVASFLLTMAIIGICTRVTRSTIKKAGVKAIMTGLVAWVIQSAIVLLLAYSFFA